jgi:hypothetical protein
VRTQFNKLLPSSKIANALNAKLLPIITFPALPYKDDEPVLPIRVTAMKANNVYPRCKRRSFAIGSLLKSHRDVLHLTNEHARWQLLFSYPVETINYSENSGFLLF